MGVGSNCNTASSENCSILSILGRTMWVLFRVVVVFPSECGSNLKLSAYEDEFDKIPVPSSNTWELVVEDKGDPVP